MTVPTFGSVETILLAGGVLLVCGAPTLGVAVGVAALVGLRGGKER